MQQRGNKDKPYNSDVPLLEEAVACAGLVNDDASVFCKLQYTEVDVTEHRNSAITRVPLTGE